MDSASVTVKGLDVVLRHLNSLTQPYRTLNAAILKTATLSRGELARATRSRAPRSKNFEYAGAKFGNATARNLSTGTLSRAWTKPLSIEHGYVVSNSLKAGKYALADIIDKGRKELISKPGHAFYLPLNRKGQNKAPGAKPEGLVFGRDYILTKRIKAFAGYHYLDGIVASASRNLTRNIIQAIREELAT